MGGKKQGSARTPHEAPDSLKSAQRLRAIGLISLGPIKGPVNKWKSTYFDNTPIQNENGIDDNDEASFNFKNTEVSFTLGTQDQAPLQGFEMSEREVSVNTEVKYTTPITRTVTDPDVTRLRVTLGVNALYEQNDKGDTNGTSVWFRILINGLPRATYEINGKSSSRFYRSYIVDHLPKRPFTITVERTTTDSKSQRLQNTTNWVSYTEIIDTKLSYPNMALVGIKTDSRYNPTFPNVNFLLYGRLVKVPGNYDPETRTYSTALWKGDWKQAWTNNPAWVFYDLVTDPLAGLGKRVGDYGLDKFQLYQIAKYCDELVDDGYGGKEPRMTANLWLTDQRSAYEVLSDMASVFRAIALWNGTQFTAIQDRTTDPVCTYSQANVIDGKFSRQYAAMKSIYTAVEVEYADERNMYQKAVEYVADDLMIDRYGYNVKKMTAYATTSRGQAHRWGKWILATSLLEQCTITFSVGRQGLLHLPGDIIEVADNDYAGKTLGGRVVAVNGKVVTLDQPIEISGNSYLSYLNDEMKVVKVAISSVDRKNKAVVTLATVPTGLEPMNDWVLKTPTVSTQLYRAIGITENDDGSYSITALQHEPQKEAIVDKSAHFVPTTQTVYHAPQINDVSAKTGYDGKLYVTVDVGSGDGEVAFDVRIFKDGNFFEYRRGLTDPNISFENLLNGAYTVTIYAKNKNGQIVSEKTTAFTIDKPPVSTGVLVTGGLGEITIEWDWVDDVTYTEIFASEDTNFANATKVAKVLSKLYSHSVGAQQTRYYWLRHVRGINNGPFYQEQGIKGESAVDLDARLEKFNEELTKNIIDEVIDSALPARHLEMIKTVNGLDVNTFLGYRQVHNTVDGKLYTWNGTVYVADSGEVFANEIKGIIQPEQLAPIPTTNLAGKLTDEQIQSINATKVIGTLSLTNMPTIPTRKLRGQLTDSQLQGISANKITGTIAVSQLASIPTTKLTGTISANQISANSIGTNAIQAGAIGATHLQSGSVGASQIQANAISSNAIQSGAVVADNIASNAITAVKISAGAITAEKLSANSVGANAIQAGAIVAGKIAANAVTTATIAAGAIRANHVAAGELTADKLAIGLGGNLLLNPIFANLAYGWESSNGNYNGGKIKRTCVKQGDISWTLKNALSSEERLIKLSFVETISQAKNQWADVCRQKIRLIPNQWYIFSAYVNSYRCGAMLLVEELNTTGGYVKAVASKSITNAGSFEHGVNQSSRNFVKFRCPESGYVEVIVRANQQTQSNPEVYVARPMLEECTQYTKEPSAWQNAGVTAIHGGSIVTNTITAQQIAANTITAKEIAGGAIATRHLSANSVNAEHIVSKSLTADKLNINSLSAISANLGAVTAGSISGTTINGGTISGTTINGGTISGTTIKSAYFESATGKFTGALEVTQLIGGNVFERAVFKSKETGKYDREYAHYECAIKCKINPAPVDRYIYIKDTIPTGRERHIISKKNDHYVYYDISKWINRNITPNVPEAFEHGGILAKNTEYTLNVSAFISGRKPSFNLIIELMMVSSRTITQL